MVLPQITKRVQICVDNMYNCLKGVPSMYWFNAGIIDAKGVHHPTVIALELGMAEPRNEVLFVIASALTHVVWQTTISYVTAVCHP